MGFFFTLLYIFTAYVGPVTVFGSLAEYRVELITIVLALLFSVPKLGGSMLAQARQTWAVLALLVAVILSYWGHGLYGLSISGGIDFTTQILVYPLVLVNCRKRWQLQTVVVTLALACGYTITRGYWDLIHNVTPSPYVFVQSYGREDAAYRLQGLGPINDPNDFGQLLAFTMPAMFLLWNKGKTLRNIVVVLLPAAFLFFGLYETHSRGAAMALLVVMIVGLRRKIGLVPSFILAGVGFVTATAVGWAGGAGREITVDQGADRLEAWSTGLQLIRANPLFGVGYKRFTEFYIITAHNTVVVCAAELGFLGLFCWVMFTLATMRDLVALQSTAPAIANKEQATADPRFGGGAPLAAAGSLAYSAAGTMQPALGTPLRWRDTAARRAGMGGRAGHESRYAGAEPGSGSFERGVDGESHAGGAARSWSAGPAALAGAPGGFADDRERSGVSAVEVHRMAAVMVPAISGYLAAGWFLSRAYVMAIFLAGALAQAIYRLGVEVGAAPPRMAWPRLLRISFLTSVGLILVVYVGLLVQHKMPH